MSGPDFGLEDWARGQLGGQLRHTFCFAQKKNPNIFFLGERSGDSSFAQRKDVQILVYGGRKYA